MTKQEFIDQIVKDITISGSLSVSLKTDEIERIVDLEKRHVYRDWRDTVELKYAVMTPAVFHTPDFRTSRRIQLPDCVWGIQEFREIKDSTRLFGMNTPDLNMERIMGSDLWLSPFSSDTITTRTVAYSWYDLARSFTLQDIQFDFNVNTHRISVIGHDPTSPVLIRAFVGIDEGDLYDDYYFYKFCLGRCMIQLHRLLKTFDNIPLVGGISVTTMYQELGKQYIDEVNEYIKEHQNPDWFLMFQ